MMSTEKPSQTSGLAIASLITALTCISPAAIICGHMAMSKIKKSGDQIGGFGLALAGTIIGYAALLFTIFSIIPVLFVGARAWKEGSDRAACIMNQKAIEGIVRMHQMEKDLKPGDPIDVAQIIAASENAHVTLTCVNGGPLVISQTITAGEEPVVSCPDHNLSSYSSSGE